MDNIYLDKYILYKNKYINLKNLIGGKNISLFNGRIIYNTKNKQTIYYHDLKKKYKLYTNKKGFNLLFKLYKLVKKYLKVNLNLIKKKNLNINDTIKDGYNIYSKKVNLFIKKKTYGSGEYVTWTKKQYSHLGFQRYYIIVKSIQRFCEIWSLLEQCNKYKMFDNISDNINIASIGGGPGFECYAFEVFLKKYFPKKKCKFYILDLEENWGNYINLIGDNYYFLKWNLYKDDIYKTTKLNNIDFIMIVNFLVMYMTNENSYNLIHRLLKNGTKSIFINSRSKKIEAKKYLKKKNINVINLLNKNDDRQLALTLNDYKKSNIKIKKIFPNIPYNKIKK